MSTSTVILILLALVVALLIGVCVLVKLLREAEEALDARFDEYGYFRFPGQINDERPKALTLGEFRGQVPQQEVWPHACRTTQFAESQPRATPRIDTGD